METKPEKGCTLPRLEYKMVASLDGDSLATIFPDFEINPGQPTGLRDGPIFFQLIAAKDCSD